MGAGLKADLGRGQVRGGKCFCSEKQEEGILV